MLKKEGLSKRKVETGINIIKLDQFLARHDLEIHTEEVEDKILPVIKDKITGIGYAVDCSEKDRTKRIKMLNLKGVDNNGS